MMTLGVFIMKASNQMILPNIGAKREPVLRHQKTIEKACEFRGFFRTERGHKLIEFRFGYVQKHL